MQLAFGGVTPVQLRGTLLSFYDRSDSEPEATAQGHRFLSKKRGHSPCGPRTPYTGDGPLSVIYCSGYDPYELMKSQSHPLESFLVTSSPSSEPSPSTIH